MEAPRTELTLLSLAIRTSRYGYVVFSGPARLLDYGAGEIISHETGNATGISRARFLFDHFRPDAIVVRWPPHKTGLHLERATALLRCIRREAWMRGTPVITIEASMIRLTFRESGASRQHGIAEVIAGHFPELHSRLPPKRKNWQHEPRFMIVFDAIAAGVAHWRVREQDNDGSMHFLDAPRP